MEEEDDDEWWEKGESASGFVESTCG